MRIRKTTFIYIEGNEECSHTDQRHACPALQLKKAFEANVLHSLCAHSCALMLNNICSEFYEHSKNEFVYYCILNVHLIR